MAGSALRRLMAEYKRKIKIFRRKICMINLFNIKLKFTNF